jgi:hypothetical protein
MPLQKSMLMGKEAYSKAKYSFTRSIKETGARHESGNLDLVLYQGKLMLLIEHSMPSGSMADPFRCPMEFPDFNALQKASWTCLPSFRIGGRTTIEELAHDTPVSPHVNPVVKSAGLIAETHQMSSALNK